jgi:hypothetical protein
MWLDGRDAEIARVIWNYFAVVEQKWPDAWKERVPGSVLNRTTGFGALMRFLRLAYLACAEIGEVPGQKGFASLFKAVHLKADEFTPDKYKPGSSGEGALYRDLAEQTGLKEG